MDKQKRIIIRRFSKRRRKSKAGESGNVTGYNIAKRRKGTIGDSCASENKLNKNNPDTWLNQNLKIKEVQGDDHIVVMDMSGNSSEWEWALLSKNNLKVWTERQTVRIFKKEPKPVEYWIENLDMPNSQPVIISFVKSGKSAFPGIK